MSTDTLDLEALATEGDAAANTDEVAEAPVVDEEAAAAAQARGAKIQAARLEKLRALFEGKQYEIIKPINLTGVLDDKGEQRRFDTPLGNKGVKGYAIKLVEGQTPEEGYPAKMIFGDSVLKFAAEKYGSLTMPESDKPTRTRRTKEQKAEDDAAKRKAKQEAMEALAAELGF